jgi:hypothetical protein
MRNLIPTTLLILVVAAGLYSHAQGNAELPPADPNLAPQDFTLDDVPISIKVPFELLVNGKQWRGHTIGWHLSTELHSPTAGSTIWLGLPGRGTYILSLAAREGYDFKKAGSIRNHVIMFQDGVDRFEIRTSGPIAGSDRAWNLYMLHEPTQEMKGPLFGVDRLGSCTLGFLRPRGSSQNPAAAVQVPR